MPTILQILPNLESGGVERGTIEIAKAIMQSGYNSIVVSNGGSLVPYLEKTGSKHIKMPVDRKCPFTIFRNAKKLRKIINDYNVDIVHARSRTPAWSAYLACKNTNAKFITTFHGVYSGKSALKKKYNSVMLKGEKIITVSNFIAEHIKSNYNFIETDKLVLIHRGVDINHFNDKNAITEKIQKYINQWHIPDDKKLILLPGRITDWKGQEFLVEALRKLDRDDYYCLMIGDDSKHPNFRNRLEKLIAEYNLQNKVSIQSNIPDIENIYKISDMVISASLRPEAFGRVAIEGCAMGKVVIATNHGGAKETIIDNKTGFLVEPGNAQDLASKISQVLDLPEETKTKIGAAALKNIKTHFTTQKMQESTMAVYNQLLKNNR